MAALSRAFLLAVAVMLVGAVPGIAHPSAEYDAENVEERYLSDESLVVYTIHAEASLASPVHGASYSLSYNGGLLPHQSGADGAGGYHVVRIYGAPSGHCPTVDWIGSAECLFQTLDGSAYELELNQQVSCDAEGEWIRYLLLSANLELTPATVGAKRALARARMWGHSEIHGLVATNEVSHAHDYQIVE